MLQKAVGSLVTTKLKSASPWPSLLGQSGRGFAKAKGKGQEAQQQSTEELSGPPGEKVIACVALERLPLIVPPPAPEVVAFRNFSAEWNDQYRRHYPEVFIDALSSSNQREKDAAELVFEPAPRITEADKVNDRKSLQRALDRRLFLIVQGYPLGYSKEKLIWHFPERLYKNEETLRLCAESVLIPTAAKEEDVYYVGNAPCGHFIETLSDLKTKTPVTYKRFFFRSQLLGNVRYKAWNYKDYAWVTKEELLEYFEVDLSAYMKQMLVDDLRFIY
ncbi:hypothetical protein GOP47_0022171 [Adiantum capillus-veneris]|uniref:39S ribosomal protein L46, mitochondrial n=1 Tax=Adiantum capillus-veneris TaxID=13818 RepID=A0A9D4Z6V4_ADICA|nr:hypothetical protein GOP47_0022171 [Adiantum capillus-veneris]